jgi:hypothetical protein
MPGVTDIGPGFSAAQVSTTDCPGLTEVTSDLNSMIRASGHGKFGGNWQLLVWPYADAFAADQSARKSVMEIIGYFFTMGLTFVKTGSACRPAV